MQTYLNNLFHISQVPQHILHELEDSINGYESIQEKCIMYLLSSKEVFSGSDLVQTLQERYIDLIAKASDFVERELKIETFSGLIKHSGVNNLEGKSHPVEVSKQKSGEHDIVANRVFTKDDDNLFASETNERNKSKIFKSMESQSKSLSFHNTSLHVGLETPGEEQVFKIQLDATIPSFDIGYEIEDQEHVLKDKKATEQGFGFLHLQKAERVRKVSNFHKSPYIDKITNINGRTYSKEETDVWEWIHQNEQYPK